MSHILTLGNDNRNKSGANLQILSENLFTDGPKFISLPEKVL